MKLLASASLRRSAGMATILRLVARAISEAVASSTSFLRAQIATSTPSLASAMAMPLPMPSLPPVTSAVLPLNWRSMVRSLMPEDGFGGLADRFDVLAAVEKGDDPAWAAFEAFVAPWEGADD